MRRGRSRGRPSRRSMFAAFAARKPPTLSGGEQVLLALHCFSRSDYPAIGIDTALEQLDPATPRARARISVAATISTRCWSTIVSIARQGWSCRDVGRDGIALSPAISRRDRESRSRARRRPSPSTACRSAIPAAATFSAALDLTLEPGRVYRLIGPNGAGKTTLFRLLAGVLAPAAGTHHARRRALCAVAHRQPHLRARGAEPGSSMVRRDLARGPCAPPPRAGALSRGSRFPTTPRCAALAAPARRRRRSTSTSMSCRWSRASALSWLWPLAGALPWIMLDEPTVGQDRATRDGARRRDRPRLRRSATAWCSSPTTTNSPPASRTGRSGSARRAGNGC